MFKINIVIPVLFFLVSCGGGGESGTCTDQDDGIVDNQNRGCDYYALNSDEC